MQFMPTLKAFSSNHRPNRPIVGPNHFIIRRFLFIAFVLLSLKIRV